MSQDLMKFIGDKLQPLSGEHQRKELEKKADALETAVDDYIEEMKEAADDVEKTG